MFCAKVYTDTDTVCTIPELGAFSLLLGFVDVCYALAEVEFGGLLVTHTLDVQDSVVGVGNDLQARKKISDQVAKERN